MPAETTFRYATRHVPRPNGSGDTLVVESVEVAGVLRPGEHPSAPDGITSDQLDMMVAHAQAQAARAWYPPIIVGDHGQSAPARVGDVRNLRRDGDWLFADLYINDGETASRIENDLLVSRSFEGALYEDGDAEFQALALTDGVPGHFDYAWPPMLVELPTIIADVRAAQWRQRNMGLARVRLSRSTSMDEKEATAAPAAGCSPEDIMAELAKLSERIDALEAPKPEEAEESEKPDEAEMAKLSRRIAEVEAQNLQLRRERELDGQADRVSLATGMARSDARVLLSKHQNVQVAASNFIEAVKLSRDAGPPAGNESTPPLNLKPAAPQDIQKALLAKADALAKKENISLSAARARVARESMLSGGV